MRQGIVLMTATVLMGSFAGVTAQRQLAPAAMIEVYKSPT